MLQRRPDLFTVSGARIQGIRKAVVERLAKGLEQSPKTASVIRALFRVLSTLPDVTLKTMKFSNVEVVQMRDCLQLAGSPEELLFVDLPQCFGLSPFTEGEQRAEDMDIFFTKLNACLIALREHPNKLKEQNRDILLRKCRLPIGDEGWRELLRRSMWLAPRVNNDVLTPFLNSINNGIEGESNPQPVLSLVANRPFEQWTDMDIERFPGLAGGIGGIFSQAWRDYDTFEPELSAEETQQKVQLQGQIESQIKALRGKNSSKVLAVALRELLAEIEKENL